VRLFNLILNIIGLELYIFMVKSTIQLFINESQYVNGESPQVNDGSQSPHSTIVRR
jgi:hypothetical protein